MFGPEPPSDVAMQRLGNQIAISTGADMLEYNVARGAGQNGAAKLSSLGVNPGGDADSANRRLIYL